jgi:hypothetical protein
LRQFSLGVGSTQHLEKILVLLSNKKMKYLDSVIPIVMVELFQKLYGVGTNRVAGFV